MKLKYCKNCLTTNLRPNAKFYNGVCIACSYDQNKSSFYNSENFLLLKDSINKTKKLLNRKNFQYDCIVGVSGGKDSTRQALWVKEKLKMNPLLVCCAYPPEQMHVKGAENIDNLIKKGFDIEILTPAPKSSKSLTRFSFFNFGNVSKATELALFSTVPRIAIEKNIPFIFWGENPALQVGDSKTAGVNPIDGNNLRKLNTLIDGGIDWMINILDKNKINHYKYPTTLDFNKKKINIYYLGPAWDDWSMHNNALFACLNGLSLNPESHLETGDITNSSMLDEEYTNINMMLKYYKFGFGRATDYVNELIRNNLLSRDQAIELVNKYDGICGDGIINRFCNYIEISEDMFWKNIHKWTNKSIFSLDGKRPKPKFKVGQL